VVGRRLVSVERCLRIASPCDAADLLPADLPELFDTAELARVAAVERRLAQQMTYCLRAMGVLETAGKRGNALVHRRVESARSFSRPHGATCTRRRCFCQLSLSERCSNASDCSVGTAICDF
jgi:hypothetical protein